MTCLALVPTVLLVYYCTGVCASQESDLVVLTTASRLREEIRSQLNETLADSLPDFSCSCDSDNTTQLSEAELCTCQPQNCTSLHEDLLDKIEERVTDSVKEVKYLLSQLFHLLIPGYTFSHSASSCKEILQLAPQSPSGLYWIRGTDNEPKHMYCDMERSCKGVAGGWMRLVSIDMTDTSSSNCPSGLRTLTSPRRLCAKNIDGAGCSSVVFPVQGVQYSRVCGKIIGY